MKKLWISAACGALALSACSQQHANIEGGRHDVEADAVEDNATARASADAAVSASNAPFASRPSGDTPRPPAIRTGAAPNVAFTHRYDFELPGKAIGSVQEEHVKLCEELGTTRCTVTGMNYDMQQDERITAMLQFSLDPQAVRLFGREAGMIVEEADGRIARSNIMGEDKSDDIKQAQHGGAKVDERIATLDRALGRKGLSQAERARLIEQRSALVEEREALADSVAQHRDAIARTPVEFNYRSASGFGWGGNAFGSGLAASLSGLGTVGGWLLLLIGLLLPWALIIGGVVWLIRRRARGNAVMASNAAPDAA